MGASLTLDATIVNYTKNGQTYNIPIPRVTVYDTEQKLKDGFTIESFNKMLRRSGNLVQLNSSWQDENKIEHPARHGKCVDNIITIYEDDEQRVYSVTNVPMLEYFQQVCAESIDADHKSFNVRPSLSIAPKQTKKA